MRLVPPRPDVPATAARFAGAWVGRWRENSGDTVCGTLVVGELLSSGHARVIYSRGAWEPLRITPPRFFRATGRIVDGVLQFVLPVPDRPRSPTNSYLMALCREQSAVAGTTP